MKKRFFGLTIAFLIAAVLPLTLAEGRVSIDFAYGDMEELFAQAMEPNALAGDIAANFEAIISIYEENPGVQDFEYATYYFCYANGYLAFLREDWATAKTSFDKCRIYNMGEEETYYCYAMGMLYAQNGDYGRAIPMFDAAASGGGSISSRALNQSMEYTRLYQDSLRASGNAAFNSGDYQTALTYFDALRTEFPESDGAELYERCLAQSNAAQVGDELSVRVLSDTEVEISWISTQEHCLLFVSMDLNAHPAPALTVADASADGKLRFDAGNSLNVWRVNGGASRRTLTLAGLFPETSYALWLSDEQGETMLCSNVFTTEAPPQHQALRVDRSVLYAYQQMAYDMTSAALKDKADFWMMLSDALQRQTAYDLAAMSVASGENGYVLIFRAVDSKGNVLSSDALGWEKLTMLLRIDGVITVSYEETADAERSVLESYNEELIALRINDFLRSAFNTYDIPTGTDYSLAVLLDGAGFLEITGDIG